MSGNQGNEASLEISARCSPPFCAENWAAVKIREGKVRSVRQTKPSGRQEVPATELTKLKQAPSDADGLAGALRVVEGAVRAKKEIKNTDFKKRFCVKLKVATVCSSLHCDSGRSQAATVVAECELSPKPSLEGKIPTGLI